MCQVSLPIYQYTHIYELVSQSDMVIFGFESSRVV